MKLAILGGGNIAKFHAKAMREAGFEISCAASSPNSSTIKDFCYQNRIAEFFEDPNDLIRSTKWDALLVCVPTSISMNYISLLRSHSRPILFEKPISHKARDISQYFLKDNFVVAYNRRFYSHIDYVKDFLGKNKNALIKVSIPETLASPIVDEITKLPYYVYDNSVHVFDLINYLAGKIDWKFNDGMQKNRKRNDSIIAYGITSKGYSVCLDMCFDAPMNFSIEIVASNERLILLPLEVMRHFKGMKVKEPSLEIPIRHYWPEQIHIIVEQALDGHKPGFLLQAKAFHDFAMYQQLGKLATITDAFEAVDVVENLGKWD